MMEQPTQDHHHNLKPGHEVAAMTEGRSFASSAGLNEQQQQPLDNGRDHTGQVSSSLKTATRVVPAESSEGEGGVPGSSNNTSTTGSAAQTATSSGRAWLVRMSAKTKKQDHKEQKSGRKGLRKKGKDLGKEERRRQKNGEGGALICFKVIKTNQYGKRQKRYDLTPTTLSPPSTIHVSSSSVLLRQPPFVFFALSPALTTAPQ